MFAFSSRATIAAVAACTALWATPAAAHVSLVHKEAEIGNRYQAVFRVPHGCKGADTIKLRVRIPAGVLDVQPLAPAGWTVATVQGAYNRSYTLNEAEIDTGIVEVVWSGGPLPDNERGEFAFSAYLDSSLTPETVLHFPAVQECADGSTARWIDIPAPGAQTAAGHADHSEHAAAPAPGVRLKAARP